MAEATAARFPEVTIAVAVTETYRNPHEILKDHPELAAKALEASRRAGLESSLVPIRGGADSTHLTFMGVPSVNLFAGTQNAHGRLEFNSRRGLEKTTETLVNLVQLFVH
jgi:tripeptide aminopeptidase